MWKSQQNQPSPVSANNPMSQISLKPKAGGKAAFKKKKTKTMLTDGDEEMIDDILSRHDSARKDEEDLDLMEGGEKEDQAGRTPTPKKDKKKHQKDTKKHHDHVHEHNESDSYYSDVESSYGTDEEEREPRAPLCTCDVDGWLLSCKKRCSECDPRKINCKTCWKSCWERSKTMTR